MSKTLVRSLAVLAFAATASQVLAGCFVESRPRPAYVAQPVYYSRPAYVAQPAYGAVYVR